MSSQHNSTQKQWFWSGAPSDQGIDGLQLREVPIPVPGPSEVLVRIRAVSLNFRDLLLAQIPNAYPGMIEEDLVPGCDPAGEVVAIGSEVEEGKFSIGERVTATFFLGDIGAGLGPEVLRTSMGAHLQGTLTEYRVFPATSLIKVPDYLSWEEAATLPCAGTTAYNAVLGGPKPPTAGQVVVIQGTGGVSLFGAQIARAAGMRVILTSSSDEKLKTVGKLVGAHHTVNYKTHPEWHEKVLELTDGRGAEFILDVAGGDDLTKSLKAVSPGGSIAIIGFLKSPETNLNLMQIIMKSITLRGIAVGDRSGLEALVRLFALHEVKPVVGKLFEFEETKAAYKALQEQGTSGKVVIRVGSARRPE